MSQSELLASKSSSVTRASHDLKQNTLEPLTKLQITTFIAYCLSLFSIGTQAACFGPILVDLQAQTNVNLATISTIFSAFAVGQIAGAILTGIILKLYDDSTSKYPRMTPHNLMGVSLMITSVLYIITPMIHNVYLLDATMALNGITFGIQATGCNYLIFAIFNVTKENVAEEKRCNTYNNLMQAAFALGGFITPLVIELSFRYFSSYSASFIFIAFVLYFPTGFYLTRVETPRKESPSIAGTMNVQEEASNNYGTMTTSETNTNKSILREITCLEVLYYVFCSVFIFVYIGSEYSFGFYITTYGLNHLSLSTSMSRLLSSAYWLGLFAGRVLGVPISICLKSLHIIIKDLLGVLFACVLLYACSGEMFIGNDKGLIVSFIASVLYGLFLASIYAANYSFANQALTQGIGSFFVSLMLLITGAATFVIPFLTGFCMSTFGAISFNTVITLCAMTMIVAFFLCWLNAKRLLVLHKRLVLDKYLCPFDAV